VLIENDLREDKPLLRSDPPIEVRRLRREDVSAYVRSHPNSPEELIRRLERGSQCHAAWHDGEIVSATWWHPGEAWIEDLDRRFLLRAGEVYFYDAWTVPRLRGRNITPARSVLTLRALREQGFMRAVAFFLPENRPIHRAAEKVGWQRFGAAGFGRIGPARIEFVHALGRTRWRARGRRAAAAPGELPPAEPGLLLSRVEHGVSHDRGRAPSRSPGRMREGEAD
jgi:RimJ/RimL family protein N-acetyltransferase